MCHFWTKTYECGHQEHGGSRCLDARLQPVALAGGSSSFPHGTRRCLPTVDDNTFEAGRCGGAPNLLACCARPALRDLYALYSYWDKCGHQACGNCTVTRTPARKMSTTTKESKGSGSRR